MKNSNRKIKLIARLMLIVMLLTLTIMTGCNLFPNTTTKQSTTNNLPEHHEPEDLVNGILAKMQAAGYTETKAKAEMYLRSFTISAIYGYPIEIIDGDIYICDFVFDDVTYVTDYCFEYGETILVSATSGSNEKYDMILKIQNYPGCYILKSEKKTGIGDKIIVYEIDGEYYFLTLYPGYDIVETVHKMTIE